MPCPYPRSLLMSSVRRRAARRGAAPAVCRIPGDQASVSRDGRTLSPAARHQHITAQPEVPVAIRGTPRPRRLGTGRVRRPSRRSRPANADAREVAEFIPTCSAASPCPHGGTTGTSAPRACRGAGCPQQVRMRVKLSLAPVARAPGGPAPAGVQGCSRSPGAACADRPRPPVRRVRAGHARFARCTPAPCFRAHCPALASRPGSRVGRNRCLCRVLLATSTTSQIVRRDTWQVVCTSTRIHLLLNQSIYRVDTSSQ